MLYYNNDARKKRDQKTVVSHGVYALRGGRRVYRYALVKIMSARQCPRGRARSEVGVTDPGRRATVDVPRDRRRDKVGDHRRRRIGTGCQTTRNQTGTPCARAGPLFKALRRGTRTRGGGARNLGVGEGIVTIGRDRRRCPNTRCDAPWWSDFCRRQRSRRERRFPRPSRTDLSRDDYK